MEGRFLSKRWPRAVAVRPILLSALGILVGILGACTAAPTATPATPTAAAAPTATATALPLKLLKVAPEKGYVGESFTVSGENLPPGKSVELAMVTSQGSYDARVEKNKALFYDKLYTPIRKTLGRATTDASGKLSATLSFPEDYGQVHDLFGVVDGADVAKGGFLISRRLEISPTQGPVGTTITVKVTGMGRGAFDSTASVLYDNRFMGFVSTVTTGGTAVFQIRAAGAPGKHYIQLQNASHALPYLNTEQSPPLYAPGLRTEFTVTPGAAVPPARLDWPDPSRVAPLSAAFPRTTVTGRGEGSGVTASLSSSTGTILSKTVLKVNGLGPEAPVAVLYGTALGNDVTGWNVSDVSLGQGKADKGGSFDFTVEIPDDLGGWHAVLVQSGDKVVAEVPYYVQRSLVEVTPTRVKAGEQFMVRIKGVGWTSLDNGVAVTYDNAYVGYACGFCCKGDTQIFLTATGGPGIHLVELYPIIYDSGQNKWPWQYNTPQLTTLQDHPGLQLGYNLPIFRLAIEIVE